MLNVVEAFSGIGSQAKALKNLKIPHEIVATIEWNIYAICAYDFIHNGKQDISPYLCMNKEELVSRLYKLNLSIDGKNPLSISSIRMMSEDALRRILCAIDRNKNLVNIKNVKGDDLPAEIDLLTYSFPCQDLSVCGSWHGNMSGIDRNVKNSSGMLWEVERILKERKILGMKIPRFLLMENVSNILSKLHRENFRSWQNYLESIGYYNQVYTLNAMDFGIPQRRIRTFMLSVFCENEYIMEKVHNYFLQHNLQGKRIRQLEPLKKFLRTDYSNPVYKKEADESHPNDTPSRRKIFQENEIIFDGKDTYAETVNTLTTKQDRNPNSGLIIYKSKAKNKSRYRYLTPRECFLLMGFEECDFQAVIDNNFKVNSNRYFFSREGLEKLAGNSIVVSVLEEIFKQLVDINEQVLNRRSVSCSNIACGM